MNFHETINKIIDLCNNKSLSFLEIGRKLEIDIKSCPRSEFLEHLDYAGVIPECFRHDSTEEKVFAKYCDILLSCSLNELGLSGRVIEARGDAADVIAEGDGYEIVGDAKAFRLSRTAKNQKDFKVESLNQWRGESNYACLTAPIFHYPKLNSQIYDQAIRYNVTLLSFTHLAFMCKSKNLDIKKLIQLWEIGKNRNPSKSAKSYWSAINKTVLEITGKKQSDWIDAVNNRYARLQEQARDQINYWGKEKERIAKMEHKDAVRELIKALKINSKINLIRKNSKN